MCRQEITESIPDNQYNRKLVPKEYLREKAFQGGWKLKVGRGGRRVVLCLLAGWGAWNSSRKLDWTQSMREEISSSEFGIDLKDHLL